LHLSADDIIFLWASAIQRFTIFVLEQEFDHCFHRDHFCNGTASEDAKVALHVKHISLCQDRVALPLLSLADCSPICPPKRAAIYGIPVSRDMLSRFISDLRVTKTC